MKAQPVPMKTTNISIDEATIINLANLAPFKIVRYEVPGKFRYLKDKNKFGRFHNALKEQLPKPYYFYSYDEPTPAIYVLYEREAEVLPLEIEFLSAEEFKQQEMKIADFTGKKLHIIIKLLLAKYFESRDNKNREAFVSQGKYYILAERMKDDRGFICLEIELKQHYPAQEFSVIGRATRFIKCEKDEIKPGYKAIYPYFFSRMGPIGGQTFLRPLKPSKIEKWEKEIFRINRHSSAPAQLAYHSVKKPEATRGYTLYKFIEKFIQFLKGYGITAIQKERNFLKHKSQLQDPNLQISNLGIIYLFDNRLNKATIPIEAYQKLLQEKYQSELGISFEVITEAELAPPKPLLVIQDYKEADFEENGKLYGEEDPYKRFYKAHPDIPKQSVNVNLNSNNEDYLEYGILELDKSFDYRFRVCFNELYLKDIILNKRDVRYLLGLTEILQLHLAQFKLQEYVFVRNRKSHPILLYVKDGHFEFVDLRAPEGKVLRDTVLEGYGLDWLNDIEQPILAKYKKNKSEDEFKPYDFILGPGRQIIEIEDIEEQILYAYEEITKRKDDTKVKYSIEGLKLAPHYDRVKAPSLTLEQCQNYDEFLDSLDLPNLQEISFAELTNKEGKYWEDIVRVLAIEPNKNGKYDVKKLKAAYQRLGLFLSDKGKGAIEGYQGIWYDSEQCYMVGSTAGINDKQSRANLIRKFHVHSGEDKLEIKLFLETLAIKFVRNEQYTVYPYPFHLIDLYVGINEFK